MKQRMIIPRSVFQPKFLVKNSTVFYISGKRTYLLEKNDALVYHDKDVSKHLINLGYKYLNLTVIQKKYPILQKTLDNLPKE